MMALPVMAPWLTEPAAAAFGSRMKPKRVLPVHDGHVKDFFLSARYAAYTNYFSGIGVQFENLLTAGAAINL